MDLFPRLCKVDKDIQPIQSSHVESVVLLLKEAEIREGLEHFGMIINTNLKIN